MSSLENELDKLRPLLLGLLAFHERGKNTVQVTQSVKGKQNEVTVVADYEDEETHRLTTATIEPGGGQQAASVVPHGGPQTGEAGSSTARFLYSANTYGQQASSASGSFHTQNTQHHSRLYYRNRTQEPPSHEVEVEVARGVSYARTLGKKGRKGQGEFSFLPFSYLLRVRIWFGFVLKPSVSPVYHAPSLVTIISAFKRESTGTHGARCTSARLHFPAYLFVLTTDQWPREYVYCFHSS